MAASGYFHWAKQSAKGTGNSADGQRLYVTDTNFAPTDLNQTRRPTINAEPFLAGSYKAGTGIAGTVSFEVPGENIGYLLYFLSGLVTVTDDTPELGVDTYTFDMATDKFSLPWFTFIESKDAVIINKGVDGRVANARIIFSAADSLQAQFGIVGITPSFGSNPTAPDDDLSPILVNCITTNTYIQVAAAAIDASQVVVDFTNVFPPLTQELKIGSEYRRDISVLARNIGITLRTWVDADWWKAIYFGAGTTWSATVYEAAIAAKAASSAAIPTKTAPYSLAFNAPKVAFGPCNAPVTARGLTLVETAANVVVPAAGDAFNFVLISVADVDFTATPS